MKKLLIAIIVLALTTLTLVGCNANTSGQTVKKIGVIQFVQHDALDDTYKGFIDGLKEAGYEDGKNIKIDFQNAQGEASNTTTIASKLVNDKNDLIFAIATPAALAVANATEDIPVLFSAVTDPVDAGLVASVEAPGGNVTGTADLAPIPDQIDLILDFVPDAKVIGILYCSNESNSAVQVAEAKKAIEALGLTYKEYSVSETSQIPVVVQSAAGQVDAMYTNTDNTIAAAMAQVSAITTANAIPIIVGEKGQVDQGALATYGINYYNLGKLTAKQAVEILEGKSPVDMPVQYQTEFELTVNENTLKELGLTIPESLSQNLSK